MTSLGARISLAAALLAAALLAGCANTVRGAGQDIKNTVDATGQAVRKVTQ